MNNNFVLHNKQVANNCVRVIDQLPTDGTIEVVIRPKEEKRTSGDNAHQWPILHAFADQIRWPVNGELIKMSAEDWKDVLTAAYKEETVRLAQGLNGGVVMLGVRTREIPKKEWPQWIEFLNWAVAEKGVKVPVNKNFVV